MIEKSLRTKRNLGLLLLTICILGCDLSSVPIESGNYEPKSEPTSELAESLVEKSGQTKLTFHDQNGFLFLHSDEIAKYHWDEHRIVLKDPDAKEVLHKIFEGRLVGGTPFYIVIDGKIALSGHLTTMLSSISVSGVCIDLHPVSEGDADLKLELGYPAAPQVVDEDPRDNLQLFEALKKLGILESGRVE